MPAANQLAPQLLSIEQILDRHPLTVEPDLSVATVVERMNWVTARACQLVCETQPPQPELTARSNCALIMSDSRRLLGIFTERDLVRLLAEGINLEAIAIAAVMTQPVITLERSQAHSLFAVMATLRHHRIRQLPIVDAAGKILGVVSQTSIRQAMQPLNFLRFRRVEEVMTDNVVQAGTADTLLELARRMSQHRTSCILITEVQRRGSLRVEVPLGIVTERDMLQFRALGLALAETPAQAVMSAPLFLVSPQDTLWAVQRQMQRRHTRRLVVADEAGGVAGIVTQTSLLQVLDPIELLEENQQLQQLNQTQTVRLTETNQQLQQTNQELHTEIAKRQRLEVALRRANQVLEERLGMQAAQLLQTDEALRREIQEREQAQVRLERFFTVTPSLLCIAGLDGYFKQLNPNFSQVLGYDNAELLAVPYLSFVHPDDRAATQAEMERLSLGEPTMAFENRYRCKDGSYRWINWNATAEPNAQVIYAAGRDVTERKQFEGILRQERDFITAVLDTVGALVVVLDPTGKIVRFNRACEQLSGYTADEVVGQEIWNILIPPEEKAEICTVFYQLKQGRAPSQYENCWVIKDGSRRLIDWSNTILSDAAGAVEYVIGTGIDVTLQRQTAQKLARQYQQGQLLGEITRKIRESIEIDDILQTTVTEVRNLLACDQVLIVKCACDETGSISETGRVVQESAQPEDAYPSLLDQVVLGNWRQLNASSERLRVLSCPDLSLLHCSRFIPDFLRQANVQACLEAALYVQDKLWGLLAAVQYSRPRQWENSETDLMQKLADQIGVALSQAELLDHLEAQVMQRTRQLTQTNHQLEREVQERIQTEAALRESQQKLEGILDNADEAIISIDSQQRIVMYNQGAETVFGYSFEEVHHQPLDILLPEAFRQIHRQYVRNFAGAAENARQMAERNSDVFGRRKNGEEFPAEASIAKLQTKTGDLFTVMLKDITERRRSETDLMQSKERLRLTTDALPVLICYVDTEQRYCFNNHTYEEWFRRPVAAFQGRYIWEFLGDEYYSQIKPQVERALLGQRVSFESELTTPDGKSRCLLSTYIPETNEQGEVKGFFGLINDISDRKATERLKDEFVSVVSHELRTPLTSIHGSLKLLASGRLGTLTPQGQDFLDISLKNTQRLTRLINDVLDLERIESGRVTMAMETCNVANLMSQAAQSMQAMADEQQVNLIVKPLEVTAWVDPDNIVQTLTNLLSNAIKFSSAGQSVWLSAALREDDVLFQIKDEGRGIPSDKLESIFERFQQVDASDSRLLGGTGLGLPICKNIVQRHGGRIWAESTLGAGSTFFFTVPNAQ